MMLLLFPTMSKTKMNQKRWNSEFQITLNHKINTDEIKIESNQQDIIQNNKNISINKKLIIDDDTLRLFNYDKNCIIKFISIKSIYWKIFKENNKKMRYLFFMEPLI